MPSVPGLAPITRVASGLGLGLFINVKNAPYSAVGDGVADDSVAFQAVLDLFKYSSGTRGGRIIVPAVDFRNEDSLFGVLELERA